MQSPKLGREVLGDHDAAGTDVSMEEVFAVKELLIEEQDEGYLMIKHIRSKLTYVNNHWEDWHNILEINDYPQWMNPTDLSDTLTFL